VYAAIHFFSQILKGTVGYYFFTKVNSIKTIKKRTKSKASHEILQGVALSLPPPLSQKIHKLIIPHTIPPNFKFFA